MITFNGKYYFVEWIRNTFFFIYVPCIVLFVLTGHVTGFNQTPYFAFSILGIVGSIIVLAVFFGNRTIEKRMHDWVVMIRKHKWITDAVNYHEENCVNVENFFNGRSLVTNNHAVKESMKGSVAISDVYHHHLINEKYNYEYEKYYILLNKCLSEQKDEILFRLL